MTTLKIKLAIIDNVFQSTLNDKKNTLETVNFIFLTYFQIKDRAMSEINIDRQSFLDLLNSIISKCEDLQIRRNLVTIVDRILLDSKCYKGYGELYWMETGHQLWINDREANPNKEISNQNEKYMGDESQKYRYCFY